MLAAIVVGVYAVAILSALYFVLFRGHRSHEFDLAERRERALIAMRLWNSDGEAQERGDE